MSPTRLARFKSVSRFFSISSGRSKCIKVLGIETSCDDTGVAVVDSERNILGESKYSQSAIHALHGGIIPHFAMELHQSNIRKAVDEAVKGSQLSIKDMDAIAVTVKPGIAASLSVGLEYAKDLCTLYGKPLIPIHHMEAHALTIRLLQNVEFPFLVLLISGGHCILAVVENVMKYLVLGESLDNSPGSLFDKMSRRLKLRNLRGFTVLQGGVAIENAARRGNPTAIPFPIAKMGKRNCNFSFSGLEGVVFKYIKDEELKLGIVGDKLLPNVGDVCASFQYALTKHVCERVEIGIQYLSFKKMLSSDPKALVVSGGVASNELLRKMLKIVCDKYNYQLFVPPKALCTDNGVMIAWNGIERLRENLPTVKPADLEQVTLSPKCPLGENISDDVTLSPWKGKYVSFEDFLKAEQESLRLLKERRLLELK